MKKFYYNIIYAMSIENNQASLKRSRFCLILNIIPDLMILFLYVIKEGYQQFSSMIKYNDLDGYYSYYEKLKIYINAEKTSLLLVKLYAFVRIIVTFIFVPFIYFFLFIKKIIYNNDKEDIVQTCNVKNKLTKEQKKMIKNHMIRLYLNHNEKMLIFK